MASRGSMTLAISQGVKVVETAGRGVPPEIMAKFKEAGIVVMHKCTSIRHALTAIDHGKQQ